MARITLDIRADDNASQILAKVNTAQAKLNREIKNGVTAQKEAQKASEDLRNAGLGLAGALTAIGAAAVVSFQKFAEQEEAIARLRGQVSSLGDEARISAGGLASIAFELERGIGVSSQEILSASKQILAMKNISSEFYERLLRLGSQAGASFGGTENAIKKLGIALEDPAGAWAKLNDAGILFKQTTLDQIKALTEAGRVSEAQNLILIEMETRFSDVSAAIDETSAGALKRFSNAFDETLRRVGEQAANFITPVTRALTDRLEAETDRFRFLDIKDSLDSIKSLVLNNTQPIESFIALNRNALEAVNDTIESLGVNADLAETIISERLRIGRDDYLKVVEVLQRVGESDRRATDARVQGARDAERRAQEAERRRLEAEAESKRIADETSRQIGGIDNDRNKQKEAFALAAESARAAGAREQARQDAIREAKLKGQEQQARDLEAALAKEQEMFDANMKSLEQIYSQGLDVFNRLFIDSIDQQISLLEKQLEEEKRFYSEQLKLKKDTGQETAQFEQDFANKQLQTEEELERLREEAARRKFERDKVLAIADATIKGAQGFVAALAGGPLGIALASVIAGLTATQIGLIASQQFPGLATGGIVEPKPGGSLFRLAEAGEPEAVIPLSKLGNMGGGITVNIGTSIGVPTRELMLTIKRELSKLATERVN